MKKNKVNPCKTCYYYKNAKNKFIIRGDSDLKDFISYECPNPYYPDADNCPFLKLGISNPFYVDEKIICNSINDLQGCNCGGVTYVDRSDVMKLTELYNYKSFAEHATEDYNSLIRDSKSKKLSVETIVAFIIGLKELQKKFGYYFNFYVVVWGEVNSKEYYYAVIPKVKYDIYINDFKNKFIYYLAMSDEDKVFYSYEDNKKEDEE